MIPADRAQGKVISMTEETRLVRIFLASPGDLEVERDAVGEAVRELNQALAPAHHARLELVRWETHSSPELGSDPQAVFNDQIGDEYDVFIGLLWTRIGTATPRADSGTLEEYERAKMRWQLDPNSVSVKFYFKEELVAPAEIDPGQLAKVQRFRADLESTALIGTFVTPDDLGRLLRVHLTRHIVGLGEETAQPSGRQPEAGSANEEQERASTGSADRDLSRGASPGQPSAVEENQEVGRYPERRTRPPAADEEEDEEEEEGLLDLVEQATHDVVESNHVLGRMTETMKFLTDSVNNSTEELRRIGSDSEPRNTQELKRTINDLADKMDTVSSRFESEVDAFKHKFINAIEVIIKLTEVSTDFGESGVDAIEANRESIASLISQTARTMEMVSGLQKTTAELPRATTKFNRSRKRLGSVLSLVQREFSSANTLLREAAGVIDKTLEVGAHDSEETT